MASVAAAAALRAAAPRSAVAATRAGRLLQARRSLVTAAAGLKPGSSLPAPHAERPRAAALIHARNEAAVARTGWHHEQAVFEALAAHSAAAASSSSRCLVSDDQRAFWRDNGFLVLKGLANEGIYRQVGAWAEEIAQWPKADGKWLLHWEASDTAPDGKIFCRAENFVNYHAGMRELSKGLLADVVSQLLGEEALLLKEKINYKLPGGSGFASHQDTPAYLKMGCDKHVSAMVAIDAATAHNGALLMAAGRWGPGVVPLNKRGVVAEEYEATLRYTPLFCEAGDVVLFDGWTPHKSSANLSAEARRAIFFTYSLARFGDLHEEYYAAKHRGAQGFNPAARISFQDDFEGKIVA